MRSVHQLVLTVTVLVFGCASGADRQPTDPPARIVSELRSLGAFASLQTAAPARHPLLRAALPSHATAPLRVEREPDFWLEVDGLHRASARRSVVDGAVVLADAEDDTDVVYANGASEVEEIRVLRSARASAVARYTLRVGPAVAKVRLHEGRVQLLDAQGVVRIESAPVLAIDARRVRRAARVRLIPHDGTWTLETEIDREGLAYPIAVDPAWTSGGAMAEYRTAQAAVRMTDGRIMVLGGSASAEIYDPASNSFTSTGSMSKAREGAMAAPLGDGRVIVGGPDHTTEIWTPATQAWTAGPDLTSGDRKMGVGIGLKDGRALFVCGFYNGSTEVFDPTTNSMTFAGDIGVHTGPAIVMLADDRVMIAGGIDNAGYPSPGVAIFDPTSSTWSGTNALKKARSNFSLGLLPDGRVLAAGGSSTVTEIWSPVTKLWAYSTSLPRGRSEPVLVPLPAGRLLVAAGGSGTADVFDPTTESFISVDGGQGRGRAQGFLLASGKAFLVGGGSNVGELFQLEALGGSCTQASECISGFCVDNVCCNSACTDACSACDLGGGTCKPVATGAPHGTRSCLPYTACAAGVCAATCAATSECASTHYCPAGVCVPKRKDGLACAGATDCESNHCVDGVCCNVECTGQCEACDVPGSFGVCTATVGAPHGARSLCSGVGIGTTCGFACDGNDRTACVYPTATTACGANTCKDGTERRTSSCNAAGLCTETAKSCGAYACGDTACKVTCGAQTDCSSGYYCKTGACVKVEDLGIPCSTGATCSTGNCVEDVCCLVDACGAEESCALGTKKGLCSKKLGVSCAVDDECGSGMCVDGLCCDARCDGQCEACDVAGALGSCQPVSGKPHGARSACSAGGGDVCKALACDGADRGRCVAFAAGPSVSCRAGACTASTYSLPASCDGKGECPASTTTSCVPYACDGKGCLTKCAAAGDCAEGFECKDSVCSARAATCTKDALASVDKLGIATPCAPYKCGADGSCAKACTSSDDCQAGTVCDNAVCVAASAVAGTGDDGGGCTLSAGRSASSPNRAFLLLALGALAARTRRVSRGALRVLSAAMLLVVGVLTACRSEEARPQLGQARSAVQGWSTLPRMNINRVDHSANALPDGRVVVIGGSVNNGGYYSSVEIYDPTTRKWTLAAEIPGHRTTHATLTLPNGKILVAGGVGESGPFAYEYDAATDTWASEGQYISSGNLPRLYPLVGGRALMVTDGGDVLRYNPTNRLYEYAGQFVKRRTAPVATTLLDGRVLFIGGIVPGSYPNNVAVDGAELYDPTTDSFSAPPSPGTNLGVMVTLPSGKVLMTGGDAKFYDPATNAWSAAPVPPLGQGSIARMLPNGRALVLGANPLTAAVYDETENLWYPLGPMSRIAWRGAFALLPDGSVMFTGGFDSTAVSLDEVELFSLAATGEACVNGGQCTSKHCVGGICCDQACAGTCEACDVAGKVGACTPIDGKAHYGRSCTAEFACVAGACPTSCTDDAPCLATGYCDGTTCLAKVARGAACTADKQCLTGKCVDGVCCDAACNGQCEACNLVGKVGECTPVYGAPQNGRAACTGTGLGTTCGAICDGKDPTKCTFAKTTTLCSASQCTDGLETHASLCDGAGTCNDVPKSCGAYACSGESCRVTCENDGHCIAGHYCKAGTCVVIEDLGTTCSAGSSCKTGFCVGGVCCATASCSAGSSCATAAKKGFCRKVAGVTCTLAEECGTGECVDGVCCESKCEGQCEACDVAGAKGKCTAVSGAPHGARTACDDGGADVCKPRICDGATDTTKCVGWKADPSVVCAPAKCEGATLTVSAMCDGAGACQTPNTTSCSPYACASGDEGCRSGCTVDAHCAEGFECRTGKCISRGNKCSDDGLESIDKDGVREPCTPFRCGSLGLCLKECATSSDCAAFSCDQPTKSCVSASAVQSEPEEGGCSVGGPGRAAHGAAAALLALAGLAARRRRAATA